MLHNKIKGKKHVYDLKISVFFFLTLMYSTKLILKTWSEWCGYGPIIIETESPPKLLQFCPNNCFTVKH